MPNALRSLILGRKIKERSAEITALREQAAELEKRSNEIAAAIEEITDETTEEERSAVEAEATAQDTAVTEHTEKLRAAEKDLSEMQEELAEIESRAAAVVKQPEKPAEKREVTRVPNRAKFFGMDIEERNEIFADEEMRGFIENYRTALQNRTITNIDLTIPNVALPVLSTIVESTSKLMKYVKLDMIKGTSRKRIWGTIPEAVWTEQRAAINELTISINEIEIDGFKVGGLFNVANSDLEDNDVTLMQKFIEALGESIVKAIDKAIVFGTGVKMPLGIITRLAQTEKPASYPADAPVWVDLHTTHINKFGAGKTGVTLFQEIIKQTKLTTNDYSKNPNVWIMNERTHADLLAESMSANMSGAIVAGIGNTMPVIGGDIVDDNDMADGDVLCGHLDLYQLVERSGTTIAMSTESRFSQDQTVIKSTARYDGTPVIANAFTLFNIGNVAPTTTATFPTDSAN